MFLGTYHNKLHGKSNYDTLAVEETYNLFNQNQKLFEGQKLEIKSANLEEICQLSKKCLLEEKTVLRLNPRLHIIGDICGNYNRIWNMISTNESTDKFLFLGDYVSNEKHSIEVITLILCMKLLAPQQVFLLRGSHETQLMTEQNGFKNECVNRFGEKIYKSFLDVFDCLPLAAIVTNDEKSKSILLMNGGLSPNFNSISQIEELKRPIQKVDDGMVHEILCSEPSNKLKEFSQNKNGYSFGSNAAHTFLKKNHLDQLVVSHQNNDFYYPFGDDDQSVLSIYSAAGMNVYIREDMLYTFSNRTNLNSYEEKLNNPVDPVVKV